MLLLLLLSALLSAAVVIAEDKFFYMKGIGLFVNIDTLAVDFLVMEGYLSNGTPFILSQASQGPLDPLHEEIIKALPQFGNWVCTMTLKRDVHFVPCFTITFSSFKAFVDIAPASTFVLDLAI